LWVTATLKILEGALLRHPIPMRLVSFSHCHLLFSAPSFLISSHGRLARLGGHEVRSAREFDSLADIVSFGLAPR